LSPHNHPDNEVLFSYAAGTLRPGFDLVVAVHLERCGSCRGAVASFEAAAAELIDDCPPAGMSPAALSATLARLDDEEPVGPPPAPGPLSDRLPLGRKRRLLPGAWSAPVKVAHAAEDRVYVVRLARGNVLKHGHAGPEFGCVLTGSLIDGDTVFGPGDFMAHDERHNHHPRVHGDDPCMCLFATTGRLKVDGFIRRVMQHLADV